jgi:hypothetical protein
MDFGFSHCYHLHLSLFPWETTSFSERLAKAYGLMRRAGATSFRPHVHWNRVEPVITDPGLRVQEVTERMIAEYAGGKEGVFWDETDMMVEGMVHAGINPFLCLGAGYLHQMPLVRLGRNVVKFDDPRVPDDVYLGHLYLHARAVVRRYKDRCRRWQLENELNETAAALLVLKWRSGRRWLSGRFKTRLVELLHGAVKREDTGAMTSHNYAMGQEMVPFLFDWVRAAARWDRFIDIIGFDPFPNYMRGDPIRIGESVSSNMKRVRALGSGKPVYILEDGYPVMPAARGFSEEGQRRYVGELLNAAEREKIDGVFIYCFVSQEGAPGNEWHKVRRFNDIEDWWGLFRSDGTPRPAYQYLVDRLGGRTDRPPTP